jgi:hypothetical protein
VTEFANDEIWGLDYYVNIFYFCASHTIATPVPASQQFPQFYVEVRIKLKQCAGKIQHTTTIF